MGARRVALASLFALTFACGRSDPSPSTDTPPPDGGVDAIPTPKVTVTDGSLIVVQGVVTNVPVSIFRDNFDGPVAMTVTGLPDGVTAAPLVIGPDASTADMIVKTLASVPQGNTPITMTATDPATGQVFSQMASVLYVQGAPGALDTTFGGTGVLSLPLGIAVRGLAVRPYDGEAIYIAGQSESGLTTLRLGADGTLDPTFGTQGVAAANLALSIADATLSAPGGLLMTGWSGKPSTGLAVVDVSKNGPLDTSFAGKGSVVTNFFPQPTWTGDLFAWSVVQGTTGLITIGGEVLVTDGNHHPLLARFESDGTFDTTFGEAGWFSQQVVPSTSDDVVTALANGRKDDGTLYAAGTTTQAGAQSLFVAHLDAQGVLDHTFGSGGFATVAESAPFAASAVAPLSLGNVLVVGTSNGQVVVTRLDSGGQLDTTYAGNGQTVLDLGAPVASGSVRAVIDTTGGVVIAAATGANNDVVVARVTFRGDLDPTFNGGGYVVVPAPKKLVAENLRLGTYGEQVVIASSTDEASPSVFAARLWGSP